MGGYAIELLRDVAESGVPVLEVGELVVEHPGADLQQ